MQGILPSYSLPRVVWCVLDVSAYTGAESGPHEQPDPKSIPIPMISIGMPEYDGGERFDLKAPYTDEGYVAKDEGFSWLNLLYIPLVGGLGVGIYLTLQALGG